MDKKSIIMTIDNENGIKNLSLSNGDVIKTVSLSDDGCAFLDSIGADIILDFDKTGKLLNIELMGF
jgi:hypothetical protein